MNTVAVRRTFESGRGGACDGARDEAIEDAAEDVTDAAPPSRSSSRHIATAALRSLHVELVLAPKPGLVCPNDDGSHRDMTATTLYASLFSLRHYFQQIADEGGNRGSFAAMRALGIAAEARMMQATRGVNVHRGAIFALGLLVASACRVARRLEHITPGAVSETLRASWGDDIRASQRGTTSHGDVVVARYGNGGAREQAACGYPAVFRLALPALRAALENGLDRRRALLQTLFVLIAELDDTKLR